MPTVYRFCLYHFFSNVKAANRHTDMQIRGTDRTRRYSKGTCCFIFFLFFFFFFFFFFTRYTDFSNCARSGWNFFKKLSCV